MRASELSGRFLYYRCFPEGTLQHLPADGATTPKAHPEALHRECSRTHRNVHELPPKNLRIEGAKVINRGNQRQKGKFTAIRGVGRRDDVVEFTRAVGDDSYHRPNRQADQGLHGSRPNAFADQDLVESCQSRSSPDSPEGVGSTHQQVRSSASEKVSAFHPLTFSRFAVNGVGGFVRWVRVEPELQSAILVIRIENRVKAHDLFVIPLNILDLLGCISGNNSNGDLLEGTVPVGTGTVIFFYATRRMFDDYVLWTPSVIGGMGRAEFAIPPFYDGHH
ncbi:hypothetical protein GEV33_002710 [Tenebrio molitor]|uniref:Uncharacterized protein n=1 Tax=Tenebrio molitor TaxID=7067 RepID=A0A8J6HR19_TENMO|nr:hypothetical protein GEV33_002710 [Tenebrio molitor]